jgi:hypothetical protein
LYLVPTHYIDFGCVGSGDPGFVDLSKTSFGQILDSDFWSDPPFFRKMAKSGQKNDHFLDPKKVPILGSQNRPKIPKIPSYQRLLKTPNRVFEIRERRHLVQKKSEKKRWGHFCHFWGFWCFLTIFGHFWDIQKKDLFLTKFKEFGIQTKFGSDPKYQKTDHLNGGPKTH